MSCELRLTFFFSIILHLCYQLQMMLYNSVHKQTSLALMFTGEIAKRYASDVWQFIKGGKDQDKINCFIQTRYPRKHVSKCNASH